MRQRCYNPNNPRYYRYGGRGITICEEWKNLNNFIEWALSNGWVEGLQIDRINNDGNYTPDNCRFVTNKQNSRNRNNHILARLGEEIKPVFMWADDARCAVPYRTLYDRLIYLGWDFEKALTTPKK